MFQSVQSQVTAFTMTGSYVEIETAKEGCHFLNVTSVSVTNSAIVFNSYENQVSFKVAAFDKIMDMEKLKRIIRENIRQSALAIAESAKPVVVDSAGNEVLNISEASDLFNSLMNNKIVI